MNIKKLIMVEFSSSIIIAMLLGQKYFLNMDFQSWVNQIAVFTIILIIKDIIQFKIMRINVFSFIAVFYWLLYIFHLGQIFLNTSLFRYDFYMYNYIQDDDITRTSIGIALLVIQLISIGIILGHSNEKDIIEKKSIIGQKQFRQAAWLITIVFTSLRLITIIKSYFVAKNGSYYDVISDLQSSGVVLQLSLFYTLGFSMLIMAYSDEKIQAKWILFVSFIINFITMATGSRIYAVISVMICIMVYICTGQSINFKNFFKYGALGVFFLMIIVVISRLREGGLVTITSMLEYLTNTKNNPVFMMLEEFGGTILTLKETVYEVPQFIPYGKGISYISSLTAVGVNVFGILDEPMKYASYTQLFVQRAPYGGSFIGELYYNFGVFSYFVAVPLGCLITFILERMEKYIKIKQYDRAAFYIMFVYGIYMWVRGYFANTVRNFCWGIVLLLVIYSFSRRYVITMNNR